MSLVNVLQVGDRVQFRQFFGAPDRNGSRSFHDLWGKVKIINRGSSVVVDAGGRHGRPVVITADTAILKATREGRSLIR